MMPSGIAEVLANASEAMFDAYNRAVRFDRAPHESTASYTHFSAMRWLALPAVRELLTAACPPGTLPMQVSQSIEFGPPLEPGQSYVIKAELATFPTEMLLSYQVSDLAGLLHTAGTIGFISVSREQLEKIIQ